MNDGTRHGRADCGWMLKGAICGTVIRDPGNLDFPHWTSRLWVCYVCGTTWASETMLDERGNMEEFEIIESTCGCRRDMPYLHNQVPGSLTMHTRHPLDTFATLPPLLQKREVALLLGA